jgi:DNA (cytosine-5)-methyltransferase 1
MQRSDEYKKSQVTSTQSCRQYKDATDLIVPSFYPQMKAESQCFRSDNISNTLVNGSNPGFQNGIVNQTVRRLTPLEDERLQGYPDHWTDIGEWTDSKGKKHKDADSPRYKALGNSIALPFWEWMAKRMVSHLDTEQPTMASLFDGIGGFPLVYSRAGCKPIWASEIEEFPIAVTKIHFPDITA